MGMKPANVFAAGLVVVFMVMVMNQFVNSYVIIKCINTTGRCNNDCTLVKNNRTGCNICVCGTVAPSKCPPRGSCGCGEFLNLTTGCYMCGCKGESDYFRSLN